MANPISNTSTESHLKLSLSKTEFLIHRLLPTKKENKSSPYLQSSAPQVGATTPLRLFRPKMLVIWILTFSYTVHPIHQSYRLYLKVYPGSATSHQPYYCAWSKPPPSQLRIQKTLKPIRCVCLALKTLRILNLFSFPGDSLVHTEQKPKYSRCSKKLTRLCRPSSTPLRHPQPHLLAFSAAVTLASLLFLDMPGMPLL